MRHSARADDYRRRRHRAATRRRGGAPSPQPLSCRGVRGLLRGAPARPQVSDRDLEVALGGLAQRLYAYPSVQGALYSSVNGCVNLHVVASRPMNRAVEMLAEAWLGEFRSLYPRFDWRVSTHTSPPDGADGLRCLFWRQP